MNYISIYYIFIYLYVWNGNPRLIPPPSLCLGIKETRAERTNTDPRLFCRSEPGPQVLRNQDTVAEPNDDCGARSGRSPL